VAPRNRSRLIPGADKSRGRRGGAARLNVDLIDHRHYLHDLDLPAADHDRPLAIGGHYGQASHLPSQLTPGKQFDRQDLG
jgi:hypothetical protein